MGASAAGLQEPQPPLFQALAHQTKKRFMNFTVQKRNGKKFASLQKNSAAVGRKCGEIINAASSGDRREHRKHLH